MSQSRFPDSAPNAIDTAGKTAAVLSIVEIGIGSILHSFRIPFSGHTLSLNQAFFLSRATLKLRSQKSSRTIGASISAIAASLKSLSPAGKKLTPMLAISAQGILFSLGTALAGPNLVGLVIGCALLSLWAFLQPVAIYYILYGETLLHIADYFFEKFQKVASFAPSDLLWVFITILSIKLLLSVAVAFLAFFLSDSHAENYEKKLIALGKNRRSRPIQTQPQSLLKNAQLALRDLFHPLFAMSLVITALFFFFVHSPLSTTIWGLLRPCAVGFLIFFAVRSLPVERIFAKLPFASAKRFEQSFRTALQTLREI